MAGSFAKQCLFSLFPVHPSCRYLEVLPEAGRRLFLYFALGQVQLRPSQTIRVHLNPAAGSRAIVRPAPGQLLVPRFASADEARAALQVALDSALVA